MPKSFALVLLLALLWGASFPILKVAAVVLLPLAALAEQPWSVAPSPRSLVAVLTLAIFSTGAALIIYFRLLATIGSIAIASQAYLRILIGVTLGVTFLDEQLDTSRIAGLVLVVGGVVAMTLPAPAPPPKR